MDYLGFWEPPPSPFKIPFLAFNKNILSLLLLETEENRETGENFSPQMFPKINDTVTESNEPQQFSSFCPCLVFLQMQSSSYSTYQVYSFQITSHQPNVISFHDHAHIGPCY